MGRVLAIDSAGRLPGAALWIDGKLSAEIYIEEAREAGEMLSREIGVMLASRRLEAADLTGLGVLTGPGSYTGLRLGLSLVRGLALVDRLPVLGMDTLELLYRMADNPDPDATFCAVLPANRGRLYAAAYGGGADAPQLRIAPAVFEVEDLLERLGQSPGFGGFCSDSEQVLEDLKDSSAARFPGAALLLLSARRAGPLACVSAAGLAASRGVPAP